MRSYGLLLHISSLPSTWGIGDLGPAAHDFVDMLSAIGARIWQILPLNPTSTFIGNSPYSSPSAFAGNPMFISPEFLIRDGYIGYGELDAACAAVAPKGLSSEPSKVDYESVAAHRQRLLQGAYESNQDRLERDPGYQDFCRQHAYWLQDYARFVSLKEAFDGQAWFCWPEAYSRRDSDALKDWDVIARNAIEREKFIQYLFFCQWEELHAKCRSNGISLFGDLPIYVTHDSADVWAKPEYFNLGDDLQPITVAGVPPDYFSPVGQRWGNPVYRWDVLEREDFSWWKQRISHKLRIVDMARLDHFRGFCAYWSIPAQMETAEVGAWVPAPGQALFTSLKKHFGCLPFLAEDLGVITPDVVELMQEFGLPGMHILQFAFSGKDFALNRDVPHNHSHQSFVYTGTHDNTTTKDWFVHALREEKNNLAAYLGWEPTEKTASACLTREAFASVARCAILPVQDALNLGGEARMNTPGTGLGNWSWRLSPGMLRLSDLDWLKELARIYGRLPS